MTLSGKAFSLSALPYFNSSSNDDLLLFFSDVDNDEWAIDAATETIQMLLKIEKTYLSPKNSVVALEEASHENQSMKDELSSSENGKDAEEVESGTVSLNIKQKLENTESEKDGSKSMNYCV